MKKSILNKMGVLFIVVCMLLTFIPIMTVMAYEPIAPLTSTPTLTTGDIVYFGRYPQRSLGTSRPVLGIEGVDWVAFTNDTEWAGEPREPFNDIRHYFEYQPIRWRVLESTDSRVFLLAEQSLDWQRLHNTSVEYLYWVNSDLRAWMNGYFLERAFTEQEQVAILETPNTGTGSWRANSLDHAGPNTEDRVFVLSRGEATREAFGFPTNTSATEGFRRTSPTEFATARGTWQTTSEGVTAHGRQTSSWALRSPGSVTLPMVSITASGAIGWSVYGITNMNTSVRPALNINLNSVIFKSDGNRVVIVPLNISTGNILTIEYGYTLTIPEGVTFTNNGTIINNGTIVNNGTIIVHFSDIINNGTISGNPIMFLPIITPTVAPGVHNNVFQLGFTAPNIEDYNVWFTTDGTNPRTSNTRIQYPTALWIMRTTTVRAVLEQGGRYGHVFDFGYIISPVITPSVPPGEQSGLILVSLTSSLPFTLYFTTDGTDPRTSGTRVQYTGAPIVIAQTTSLRVAGVSEGAWGIVNLFEYIFNDASVTPSVEPGTFNAVFPLTLTTHEAFDIYTNINDDYERYTEPIYIYK